MKTFVVFKNIAYWPDNNLIPTAVFNSLYEAKKQD